MTPNLKRDRFLQPGTDLQEGNDAVPSNGLEEPGGPRQALQSCPTAREEGANHNDPGGRPGQNTDDWASLY